MVERASDQQDSPARPPKRYETPRLVVYGDIATLTKDLGRAGAKDGGTPPTIRSQP